jgi:CHAD domain-containing protein
MEICVAACHSVSFTSVANVKTSQVTAAVLSVRLLALLGKISGRASKKDVHLLRTTVRRLEVQLGEAPPKVARALKRVRRRAGKVRDTDVHLGLIEEACRAPGARSAEESAEWMKLRKVLKERRAKYLESLRSEISDYAPVLRRRLPAAAEAVSDNEVTATDAHAQAKRARERYLRWARAVPSDPERLHRMRINTKNLRYALEPLERFEEAAKLVARFKQVQDAIGNWHDWLTLEELAQKSLRGAGSKAVCAALRARAGRDFRKAHRCAESVRDWIGGGRPTAPARRQPQPISNGEVQQSIHRVS